MPQKNHFRAARDSAGRAHRPTLRLSDTAPDDSVALATAGGVSAAQVTTSKASTPVINTLVQFTSFTTFGKPEGPASPERDLPKAPKCSFAILPGGIRRRSRRPAKPAKESAGNVHVVVVGRADVIPSWAEPVPAAKPGRLHPDPGGVDIATSRSNAAEEDTSNSASTCAAV